MKLEELNTIEQLVDFLSGTQAVAFSVISNTDDRYHWIQGSLVRFRYLSLSKRDKGIVVCYLMKVSGYSRQQITRLITQYRKTGVLKRQQRTVAGFACKYTAEDIRLLAQMDERHDTPCGPAVKKLCERACQVFDQAEYTTLSTISVSHLYNLRKSTAYARQRRHFTKTQPRRSSIGERRKPRPNGEPGYIRIDTVHQGDQDKQKGVYHINVVDEVTQFEAVCTVERISECYLIPALKVLLDKLFIEFTQSRSRHSNDNALAESKNASVVRKQFGYTHIPQYWAPLINDFNQKHLNPYINYHRPCFFPQTHTDDKGKERKTYPYASMMTPYDKLKSLANAKDYLKPGTSFEILDKLAHQISDNQAADQLKKVRSKLFNTIHGRTLKTG